MTSQAAAAVQGRLAGSLGFNRNANAPEANGNKCQEICFHLLAFFSPNRAFSKGYGQLK
jgi:hypothetical protein